MIRLNKEIKLNNCKNINLKYGSINKNDPQVIYVSGKMWLCPTYDGNYSEQVNLVYNSFKRKLNSALSNSKNSNDFIIENGRYKIKPNRLSIISTNFGYLFKELEDELIENEFEVSKTK